MTRKSAGQLSARPAAPESRRVYYGWYVVVVGFLINFAYSEQFAASYGVFIHHIEASTG